MPAKGRVGYVATVHGEVDGVPFTNWFKYLPSAVKNCKDSSNFYLTHIETKFQYRWSRNQGKMVSMSIGAPEFELL